MPSIDVLRDWPITDSKLMALIESAPVMPLDDAGADVATVQRLERWLATKPSLTACCLAGLWLLAGDLQRSHAISQGLETREGAYWHGIMHRREGDYWNSKYWMKQVGSHPVSDQLASTYPVYQSAVRFVDLCQRAASSPNGDREQAIQIQWSEWQLLFAHSFN